MTRDASLMKGDSQGPWYYEQVALGFNYRMTELQAALGVSQLPRLHAYVARRHELANTYDRALSRLPLTTPWQHPDTYSAFHLYVVRLRLGTSPSRRAVFDHMRQSGVGVNVHYIPVHTQPWYAKQGFKPGDFPEAERYYAEALSLPMYPTLSEEQLAHVCAALGESVAA
jgi:dTDP-4-amino-4,6-dideoxygalactose transaminase